jgi:hypothetical protein
LPIQCFLYFKEMFESTIHGGTFCKLNYYWWNWKTSRTTIAIHANLQRNVYSFWFVQSNMLDETQFLTSSWFFDCTVSYRLSLNFIGKLCKITQITLYCVRLMGYLPRWNLFMKKKVYLYKKSGICGCSWYSMKFVINHPAWLPFLNKLNRT